jgi:hypothetical protein
MPSAERVIADIRGDNPMDTRARQIAALSRLYEIMREMARNRFATGEFPNPEEKPIVDGYLGSISRLRNEGLASFGGVTGLDSPRGRWMLSIERYQNSRALSDDLMARYFSRETQALHRAAVGAQAAQAAAGRASIDQGFRDLAGVRDSRWERMSAEEQQGALALGLVLSLLLAVGAIREMRPFRVTDGSPPMLRAGFRRCRLGWATGTLTNHTYQDKGRTTVTEEDLPSGEVKRTIWTSVIRTEDFDLLQAADRHHVTMAHAAADANSKTTQFGPYVGRTVTAVWRTRRLKASPYLLFLTPDTTALIGPSNGTRELHKILAPRLWTIVPAAAFGFLVGSSTDSLGSAIPFDAASFRGFTVAILAAVLWMVGYFAISFVRQRRFFATEVPKIHAIVHSRDVAQPHSAP